MEIYVGTCGWMYDWNPDGFEWYVKNSGLNAVELNASFYRFPFRTQVKSWSVKGRNIRWAIKVHRSITHFKKLSSESLNIWFRFLDIFKPLMDNIDFFLIQLPPSFKANYTNYSKIKNFVENCNVDVRKLAFEFRHPSCFSKNWVEKILSLGCIFVSVDAPNLPREIYVSRDGVVYVRMHGRLTWYSYNYSVRELLEVARNIVSKSPSKVYVFFNNDHDMLNNAREMFELLKSISL